MLNSEPPHPPLHCQHAEVIERIHAGEVRLAQLESEVQGLRAEVSRLVVWVREHSRRGAWLYAAEAELKAMVESSHWLSLTKRLLAWLGGAAAGFLVFWETAERWLRGHLHG